MKTVWMAFLLLAGMAGMAQQPLKKITKGGKSEVKITMKKEPIPLDLNGVLLALSSPLQTFQIKAERDTVLRGANGTLLYYYGNSLVDENGLPITGKAELTLKESLEYHEMIGDKLSTETENGLLETRGMFKLGARKGNQELKLKPGASLTAMVPNKLGNGDMQVWNPTQTPNSQPLLSSSKGRNITSWQSPNPVSQFTPSSYVNCGWSVPDKLVKKCNFWCKFRRFLGMKAISQTSRKMVSLRADFWSPMGCAGFDSLISKYNVRNHQQLFPYVYAPLMKQYKVTSLKQLFYRMEQERRVNVEKTLASGNVSFQNLNYYVFSTNELSWRNLDAFYHMSDDQIVEQKIREKHDSTISVSLIFKERKMIVAAYVDPNKLFHYPRVPKTESGTVVAIKVRDGKPMLAMHEIRFGEKDLDLQFKEVTLEELKSSIKAAGL